MTAPRVVIVGGGFAAVQFAKTLRGKLSQSQCEILLFNPENHMVFQPLLADVAGASINIDAAATPLRQMLPKVGCRMERVQRIDLAASEIAFDEGRGVLQRLHYDQVVIACGAEGNLSIIPGMTEHAFGFKVMSDAIELRRHIVAQMEQAETTRDPQRRRWHLSFIIVGAGFSGVEAAGEINELVRSSTRFYHNFRKSDLVVSLIHPKDQILPEVAPRLAEFARKKMEKAGISLVLNTRAVAATHEGVVLSDGQMLSGATIVCTIGTAPSTLVQYLDVPKERGRILTELDMRIRGHINAWAIGDCALIINAHDNKPSLTTGQFAERQGRQAALNLVRVFKGEPTQPFRFKALGELCSIGGYQAVAEMFGMHVSGLLAWFLWRSVYLSKLPTWSRRSKVALDWAWDLLFPRDLSFLNSDAGKHFTRVYYRPGDLIQRQGDPARVFSVIEEGQVRSKSWSRTHRTLRKKSCPSSVRATFLAMPRCSRTARIEPVFARGPPFVCVKAAVPSFRRLSVLLRLCGNCWPTPLLVIQTNSGVACPSRGLCWIVSPLPPSLTRSPATLLPRTLASTRRSNACGKAPTESSSFLTKRTVCGENWTAETSIK